MKRMLLLMALCGSAACASAQTAVGTPASPTKKELVQKVLQLQQSGYENMARNVAERPAMQLMQDVMRVLQTQVAPEKREAAGKAIEADVKKFVDEAVPLLRERAVRLAPSTFGVVLEEKFTEDELKQLIAWSESPVNKKFQQALPEVQNSFIQKLVSEASPLLDPKLQALQLKIRSTLASTSTAASGATAGRAAPGSSAVKK